MDWNGMEGLFQVKKRFMPTLSHLCEAGIINDNEKEVIESLYKKCIQVFTSHSHSVWLS